MSSKVVFSLYTFFLLAFGICIGISLTRSEYFAAVGYLIIALVVMWIVIRK